MSVVVPTVHIGGGYSRTSNCSRLFYNRKVIPEITFLEDLENVKLLSFGKHAYLRTKYSLIHEGSVIVQGTKRKLGNLTYIGNGYLKNHMFLIHNGCIAKRLLFDKSEYKITKLVGEDYLQTRTCLFYGTKEVEQFRKTKKTYSVKTIGNSGYVQTPRHLIFRGEIVMKITPLSNPVFVHRDYLLCERSLIYNGTIVNTFTKAEVKSLRIFNSGEYIATNDTLMYNHTMIFKNINRELYNVAYLGNSYLKTESLIYYMGKEIHRFPANVRRATIRYNLIKHLNLVEFGFESYVTDVDGEWMGFEKNRLYFRGAEKITSGRVLRSIPRILARVNDAWSVNTHVDYSGEFRGLVMNLLACTKFAKNIFISKDVMLYIIIPYIPEIDVFLNICQLNSRFESDDEDDLALGYSDDDEYDDDSTFSLQFQLMEMNKKMMTKRYNNKMKKKRKLKRRWMEKKRLQKKKKESLM